MRSPPSAKAVSTIPSAVLTTGRRFRKHRPRARRKPTSDGRCFTSFAGANRARALLASKRDSILMSTAARETFTDDHHHAMTTSRENVTWSNTERQNTTRLFDSPRDHFRRLHPTGYQEATMALNERKAKSEAPGGQRPARDGVPRRRRARPGRQQVGRPHRLPVEPSDCPSIPRATEGHRRHYAERAYRTAASPRALRSRSTPDFRRGSVARRIPADGTSAAPSSIPGRAIEMEPRARERRCVGATPLRRG